MKNEAFKGKGNALPEKSPVQLPEPVSRNRLLVAVRWVWHRLFPKSDTSHFLRFRRKKTKPDGTSIETEFLYRKDH